MDTQQEIEATKQRIKELLKKTPRPDRIDSYNKSSAYREVAKKARSLAESSKSSFALTTQVYRQLLSYHQ